MKKTLVPLLVMPLLGISTFAQTNTPATVKTPAPTPAIQLPDQNGLYVPAFPYVFDPLTDNLGDPTILFNHQLGNAWIYYTQRAHFKTKGPGWYCGTPVGILSSGYGGFSWMYRGTAEGLDDAYEPGCNSFWAPEVIYDGKTYHMYVTFVRGVPLYNGPQGWKYGAQESDTRGNGVLHFTGTDMIRWKFAGRIPLEPDNGNVIDPAIHPLPDGTWRMWYRARVKATGGKSLIGYADSKDLVHWQSKGPAIEYDGYAEGPCIFHWKGQYWMLLDNMKREYGGGGLAVYRSHDATKWELQPGGLLGTPVPNKGDSRAGHGSVIVQGDRAFLLSQGRAGSHGCAGWLAELHYENGKLTGTREIAPMKLEAAKAPKFRGGDAPDLTAPTD